MSLPKSGISSVSKASVRLPGAVISFLLFSFTAIWAQTAVFINEIHYDNAGADAGEAVEIAGPAGTDLAGWSLVFYNGNGGASYSTLNLSGAIPDLSNGFGVLDFPQPGMQNGSPDGLALVDPSGNLIQFLSYEGSLTAVGGPADGLISIDIGVEESSSAPIGNSLQLEGTGSTYEDFTWNGGAPNSFGAINSNQVFGAAVPNIVINELDADSPGDDVAEFIELYDGGTGNTVLDGLVLVLFNGNGDVSYAAFDLDGQSTDATGFFVLCANAANVPNCDLDVTPDMDVIQNGADAVALYTGDDTDFTNGAAVITTGLIDAIVYDTDDADDAGLLVLLSTGQPQVDEGSGGDSETHSSQRIPNGAGGQRNTAAFVPLPPTPGTENMAPLATVEIFEIQGSGLFSPFAGQTVTTENNVVTALAPNGFFIQTPVSRSDADINTSDGIFVFTGGGPGVSVGDLVTVTGQVVELFDFTEFTNGPAVTIEIPGGGTVPAAVVFDGTTPAPGAPQSSTEFERFESMLIEVQSGIVGASNQRFGTDPIAEVFITASNTRAFREPGIEFPGLPGLPVWDGNPEVFELDPDKLGLPNAIIPGGSTFNAHGVLGFEFGGYEFWPASLTVDAGPLPPVRDRNPDEATIGSLNLFRLFDDVDDPPDGDRDDTVVSTAEYARRRAKFVFYILNVLKAPDILAVQEAEKLEVLQDLAGDIKTIDASVDYAAYLEEGNDVGTIDVGFLVRQNVQVSSVTQLGASETLSVDGSLLHDRPPLLLEGSFIVNGSPSFPIAVLGVHNRSLGGIDDPADGPRVRQKRLEQAQSIAQKIQDLQTADPNVCLVVTGDFNAFQFTDGYVDAVGQISGHFTPGDNLLSGPDLVEPNLTNQVLSLPAAEGYSFIFDGSAQVLDHALTTTALNPAVTDFAYGRGNADAAVDLINDDSTPLRASDHDGLVMHLDVTPPQITVSEPAQLWPPNLEYHRFAATDFVTSIFDGVDGDIDVSQVFIVSISSDEPEDSDGDGNTVNDIVIVDCQTIELRAERDESSNGRVYSINVAAADQAGNAGMAIFQVEVPVSDTGEGAVDDGPVYVVTSECSMPTEVRSTPADSPDGTGDPSQVLVPHEYRLEPNYPNPFNPSTTIAFALPQASEVNLKIYNLKGQLVKTLVQGSISAGFHNATWDGTDTGGVKVASGVYIYRLEAKDFVSTKKLVLSK